MSGHEYPGKREPQVEDTIWYKLRSEQAPVNPEKVWRGKILLILVDIMDRSQRRFYLIESLESGYEYDRELVYPEQVVGFE